MIFLAFFFQVMDILTFLLAFHRYGINGELSFVPAWLYSVGGLPLMVFTKLAFATLCIGVAIWLQDRNPIASRLGVVSVILVGVAGLASNLVAVFI